MEIPDTRKRPPGLSSSCVFCSSWGHVRLRLLREGRDGLEDSGWVTDTRTAPCPTRTTRGLKGRAVTYQYSRFDVFWIDLDL